MIIREQTEERITLRSQMNEVIELLFDIFCYDNLFFSKNRRPLRGVNDFVRCIKLLKNY